MSQNQDKNSIKMPHKITLDIQKKLSLSQNITKIWDNLTSIAKNEWICWVISAKKIETRNKRIKRLVEDIQKGKKRPCCWGGCPHRKK